MKHSKSIAYILATLFCATAAAFAPLGGGNFDLSWHTIDGGGGTSAGGGFELSGTIGQHDAGQTMTGGSFALTGGFWAGTGSAPGIPCPWDLDGSGSVGTSDLLELFAQWGSAGPADFDESGSVGTSDLLILFANWGPCE
ncbi:MAG: hypothetical protein IH984_17355 [Planctomycetes bacterium]|nr:hypothetical protein [Planctomycetota bacterium]